MTEESPVAVLRLVLTVHDYESALAFWRDGLGLPVEATFGEGKERGALLGAGRAVVELLTVATAEAVDRLEVGRSDPVPFRLALEVADSPGTADRLAAAGATKAGDVVETAWGHRSVRLKTPDGMAMTVYAVMKK